MPRGKYWKPECLFLVYIPNCLVFTQATQWLTRRKTPSYLLTQAMMLLEREREGGGGGERETVEQQSKHVLVLQKLLIQLFAHEGFVKACPVSP